MNYLIRLDDACPNMNLVNWNRIISILNKYDVSSIIAAIPYNLDSSFNYPTIKNYSYILKKWNLKHEIAIHGYNHLYNSIAKPIYGVKKKSEFAGKSYNKQKEILEKGLKFFKKIKIFPRVFVAPGHSFDNTTVDVIRDNFPEMIISDGMFISPVIHHGVKFLPQQIANCRHISFGTITFCYHPNNMQEKDFIQLEKFMIKYKDNFKNIDDLVFTKCSIFHYLFDKTLNKLKHIYFNVRNFSY